MVAALCKFDPAAAQTPEFAEQWKANFQQLVTSGPAGVAAIAEFLKQNTDLAFDDPKAFGFASARLAMVDALGKMGGTEAIGLMSEMLQTAAVPREIAALAKQLDALAPEQYRQQAVDAARQTLAMAKGNQLEGYDVAPLFEVLQQYGGAGALPDLTQQGAAWRNYAAMALAALPDGAGVPALVEMTQPTPGGGTNPGRHAALEALTQMAVGNAQARAALVEQISANTLPPYMWAYMEPLLAGNERYFQDSVLNDQILALLEAKTSSSHISSNNENFFYASRGGGLTVEQVQQQMSLVNDLRAATKDPQALQSLERAQRKLDQLLTQADATAKLKLDSPEAN